jgi:hypothetical protein
MSMDRLKSVLAGGTMAMLLGMLVTASGCRSTKNEVPSGRPYSTTGDPTSGVGFNSDPRPNNAMGSGLYGNPYTPGQPGMGGSAAPGAGGSSPGTGADGLPAPGAGGSQYGTPTPSQSNLNAPTNNRYGGPGTAGYGTGQ